MTLDDLIAGVRVTGLDPAGPVTVVAVQWHGSSAVTLTYRDDKAQVHERLVLRADEGTFEIIEGTQRRWSFDADGDLFRLAAESRRIHLAYLFDPMIAVTTSQIDPLPHQIQAVYGEMLPRQPLRFLLADDPGAGKTIMAGLYMKELMLRGDAHRVLASRRPGGARSRRSRHSRRSRVSRNRSPPEAQSSSQRELARLKRGACCRSRVPIGAGEAKSVGTACAGLNQAPSPSWPGNACYTVTAHQGLCDEVRR